MISLIFAGLNDVIFKKYSIKPLSRGMYIFCIGIVWTSLQGIAVLIKNNTIVFNTPTLEFGFSAGIILFFSNILLLESLKYLDVGLGSTIYRLNTVGVIVLSFFFLREPIGCIKGLGILLAIIAVLFLYEPPVFQTKRNHFMIFFAVAIVASLSRACYGIVTKVGILKQADPQLMLTIVSVCWIFGGILYAVFKEKNLYFSIRTLLYSCLSGIMIFFIAFFLTLALQYGQATVVIPIANMGFLISLALAVSMRMEQLTRKKGVSIIIATCAIIFLSRV